MDLQSSNDRQSNSQEGIKSCLLVICKFLHREDISKLYCSSHELNALITADSKYIYTYVCLHYQPHNKCLDSNGFQLWYKEGKIHRDGDLPAIIYSYGDQAWYKDGKIHRDGDLPAKIYTNGDQHWYKDGKLHRDGDLPAIISSNGDQYWYKDGKKHRDGDLPAIISPNGIQSWYKEGMYKGGKWPRLMCYE